MSIVKCVSSKVVIETEYILGLNHEVEIAIHRCPLVAFWNTCSHSSMRIQKEFMSPGPSSLSNSSLQQVFFFHTGVVYAFILLHCGSFCGIGYKRTVYTVFKPSVFQRQDLARCCPE